MSPGPRHTSGWRRIPQKGGASLAMLAATSTLLSIVVAAVTTIAAPPVRAQQGPGEDRLLASGALPSAADLPALYPGEIVDEAGCKKRRGRWTSDGEIKLCRVGGKAVGVFQRVRPDGSLKMVAQVGDGAMDGPAYYFFASGSLQYSGAYKNDERVGQWRGYYPTGRLRSVESFVADKREGASLSWYASGQPQVEASYVDGEYDGAFIEWHLSCFKSLEGHYAAGKRVGAWREWTAKGVLKSEGRYGPDGERTGRWRIYHEEDAVLVAEGDYEGGKRQGSWVEWFTNGHRWREVDFEAGKRTTADAKACAVQDTEDKPAVWTVDYRARTEGCLVGASAFEAGERRGVWTGYYKDGRKQWRYHYQEGVMTGEATDWHPGGEVLREGLYVGGIPIGLHVFRGPDGREYGRATISDDGSGDWSAWFADGQQGEAGAYKEGKKQGVWTTWFDNGNKASIQTYSDGLREGTIKKWFESGEPKVDGAYAWDNRDGHWIAYYTNGQKAWEGRFEAGDRVGEWRDYYWEGELEAVGPRVKDARQGTWIEYYDNGRKKAEGPYVADKKHGVWKLWWRSGEFWQEVTYAEGKEQGTGRDACEGIGGAWQQDSESRVTGCFVCRWEPGEEVMVGDEPPATEPDDPGSAGGADSTNTTGADSTDAISTGATGATGADATSGSTQEPLNQETPTGDTDFGPRGEVGTSGEELWSYWYANGNKEKEGALEDDKPHGVWRFWFVTGDKRMEGRFHRGKEVGQWQGWYPGGAKRFTGHYDGGRETGEWTTWDQSGQPISRGRFEGGKKSGLWTWWHRAPAPKSGQPAATSGGAPAKKDEGEFIDGEEAGIWRGFYPSGAKKSEGSFVSGAREGTWTWWREDGQVWRVINYKDGKEAGP